MEDKLKINAQQKERYALTSSYTVTFPALRKHALGAIWGRVKDGFVFVSAIAQYVSPRVKNMLLVNSHKRRLTEKTPVSVQSHVVLSTLTQQIQITEMPFYIFLFTTLP